MRLSRELRYAVRALVVLAEAPDGYVAAETIATRAGLPAAYLRKVLRRLVVAGVLSSRRGRGFSLARRASAIRLREVMRAIEGERPFDRRCIFWREQCSESDPCELHFLWKEIRPRVEREIGGATLQEVASSGSRAPA
jgi:Rrf2 family protein